MVVAGGDVAGQRAQHVEWCAAAYAFFQPHVGLDLVEWDVARPFDHHLHAQVARALGQFAQYQQFGYLAAIGGVAGGAGCADRLAALNLLADADEDLREVAVHRRQPAVVVDGDHVAATALIARHDDRSGRRGGDRRPGRHRNVDTVVHDEAVIDRVHPHPERAGDRAGDRPQQLARRTGLGRQLLAGQLTRAALRQPARLFFALLLDDQRFELGLLGRRHVVELHDLSLHVAPLGVGGGDEVLALRGQPVERALLLARLVLFAGELGPHAEQPVLDRGDARCVAPARADRRLVGLDQKANVVPALDEVGERARAQQHVDVPEVAVLVRVDQSAIERVLVAPQRRLGRVELDLVPGQLALRRANAALDVVQVRVDRRDVAIRRGELRLQIVLTRLGGLELTALLVQLEVNVVNLGLLLVDLLVDPALADAGTRHERNAQDGGDEDAEQLEQQESPEQQLGRVIASEDQPRIDRASC